MTLKEIKFEAKQLDFLFSILKNQGYNLIGPTLDGEVITYDIIQNATKYIDRYKSLEELFDLNKDIDLAISIEASIFEFTIVYVLTNDLLENLMSAVYYDKLNDIKHLLDKKSKHYNKTLMDNISKKKINPQEIAFMSPQDIDPDNWKALIKKKELMEYKKNNMAATDLYKCYKCGKRRCKVTQAQLRGADESTTTIVTCLICHNTWKSS